MPRIVGAWFLTCVSFVACARPEAAPTSSSDAASEFVRLYAAGRLTGEDSRRLLGADAAIEREGAYWQARSADRLMTIVVRAKELNEPSDDAQLRLALEANLTLADVQRSFGTWQPVSTGESSSVVFRVVDRPDRPVLVFVRLGSPKPRPDSSVLSIQPRLEKAAQ